MKGQLINYVGSKGQKTPEVTTGSRIISINGKTSGSSEGGNTGEVAGDVTMKASEMGFTAKGIATKATMSDGTVLTSRKEKEVMILSIMMVIMQVCDFMQRIL